MATSITLSEIKGKELDKYILTIGYSLQAQDDLQETFPALISKGNKSFVCIDKDLLKEVQKRLPKKRTLVTKLQLFANLAGGVSFDVSAGREGEPIHILSEKEFDVLVENIGQPFKWAS